MESKAVFFFIAQIAKKTDTIHQGTTKRHPRKPNFRSGIPFPTSQRNHHRKWLKKRKMMACPTRLGSLVIPSMPWGLPKPWELSVGKQSILILMKGACF